MAMHDKDRMALGGQALQPTTQELIQRNLADADRRVAIHTVHDQILGYIFGCAYDDIAEPEADRVGVAEFAGTLVDVDRPNPGIGIAAPKDAGDGSVTAADIDEFLRSGRRRRSVHEEQLGAWVDAAGSENAPVGAQRQGHIGQRQGDGFRTRSHGGRSGEVLLGRRHRGEGYSLGRSPMPVTPVPHPRRVVYLGSPALAVPPLEALVRAGYEVVLVVTRPDKRRGRGGTAEASPVKVAAERLGIPVSYDVDDALSVRADLGIVVAFGQLIRPHVLAELAFVNLHFSLLPRWRGAAPVERAILAGDPKTGVCLMALEQELDVGGIYRQAEVTIDPEESLEELRGRLVVLGTDLLLGALAQGFGPAVAQAGEPTYAAKVRPGELELRFDRPAVELARITRLGRAYTSFRGKRVLVHRATTVEEPLAGEPATLVGTRVVCGIGGLELLVVQPEGKGRQNAQDWARGARPQPADRLGG